MIVHNHSLSWDQHPHRHVLLCILVDYCHWHVRTQEEVVKITCHLLFCPNKQLDTHEASVIPYFIEQGNWPRFSEILFWVGSKAAMTARKSPRSRFEDDMMEHTLDVAPTPGQQCSLLVSVHIDQSFGWGYASGDFVTQISVKMAIPTHLIYQKALHFYSKSEILISNGIHMHTHTLVRTSWWWICQCKIHTCTETFQSILF